MKEGDLITDKQIQDALLKKALGYDATETVEEFVTEEGEVKLCKKKVTKKNVPPDISAIKMLMESGCKPVKEMSDEELEKESERLYKLLEKEKKKEKKVGKKK